MTYDFGPPPLSDEELQRLNSVMKYDNPRVKELVWLLWDKDHKVRDSAVMELDRIRGEQ